MTPQIVTLTSPPLTDIEAAARAARQAYDAQTAAITANVEAEVRVLAQVLELVRPCIDVAGQRPPARRVKGAAEPELFRERHLLLDGPFAPLLLPATGGFYREGIWLGAQTPPGHVLRLVVQDQGIDTTSWDAETSEPPIDGALLHRHPLPEILRTILAQLEAQRGRVKAAAKLEARTAKLKAVSALLAGGL